MQSPTPPAPPQRKWNDAERQQVKSLLAKGATAGTVARAMSIGRNQALGRIWRDPELTLQAYPRPKTIITRPIKPKRIPKPTPPPKPAIVSPPRDIVAKPAPVRKKPVAPPLVHPMPLIGTGNRWCKWPVANAPDVLGGFLCCGNPSPNGDVYCEWHRAQSNREPRP